MKNILKKNSEFLTLPLAFLLWFYSGDLLRLMDPTAATYDAGIFQNALYAVIVLLAFHAVVRAIMKMQWGTLDKHLDKYFETAFYKITPWERLKISLFVFFSLLFALVLLTLSLGA
jgi:hypothetical protein